MSAKINIVKDFKNTLLKRREVEASVDSVKNPGFDIVRKDIAEHYKVAEDLILINNIRGNFGSHNFFIDAFIYNSVEDKNSITPKKKVKKEAGK